MAPSPLLEASCTSHPTVAMWLPPLAWVAVGWSHPSTLFSIYLFIIYFFVFCVFCIFLFTSIRGKITWHLIHITWFHWFYVNNMLVSTSTVKNLTEKLNQWNDLFVTCPKLSLIVKIWNLDPYLLQGQNLREYKIIFLKTRMLQRD